MIKIIVYFLMYKYLLVLYNYIKDRNKVRTWGNYNEKEK